MSRVLVLIAFQILFPISTSHQLSGSGRTVITLSRRMAIVTGASEERGRKSGGKNSLVEEGRGIGVCRWGGARQESALED